MLSIKKLSELVKECSGKLVYLTENTSDTWIDVLTEVLEIPGFIRVSNEAEAVECLVDGSILITNNFTALSNATTRDKPSIMGFNSDLAVMLSKRPEVEFKWNGRSIWSHTLLSTKVFIVNRGMDDDTVNAEVVLSLLNGDIVEDPRESDILLCCKNYQFINSEIPASFILEAIVQLEKPMKGQPWLKQLRDDPDGFQDILGDLSENGVFFGLQFWVPPGFFSDYIIKSGGIISNEPSIATIAVIPEESVHQISYADMIKLGNANCVLVKEDWMKNAASNGKFGPLENAYSTCPVPRPFHTLRVAEFRDRSIFITGDTDGKVTSDVKRLEAVVTENLELADTVLCNRATAVKLPQFARNFSCLNKWLEEKIPHECQTCCIPIIIPKDKRGVLDGQRYLVLSVSEEGRNVRKAIREMGGSVVDKHDALVQWIWDEPYGKSVVIDFVTNVCAKSTQLPLYGMRLVREIPLLGEKVAKEKNRITKEYVQGTSVREEANAEMRFAVREEPIDQTEHDKEAHENEEVTMDDGGGEDASINQPISVGAVEKSGNMAKRKAEDITDQGDANVNSGEVSVVAEVPANHKKGIKVQTKIAFDINRIYFTIPTTTHAKPKQPPAKRNKWESVAQSSPITPVRSDRVRPRRNIVMEPGTNFSPAYVSESASHNNTTFQMAQISKKSVQTDEIPCSSIAVQGVGKQNLSVQVQTDGIQNSSVEIQTDGTLNSSVEIQTDCTLNSSVDVQTSPIHRMNSVAQTSPVKTDKTAQLSSTLTRLLNCDHFHDAILVSKSPATLSTSISAVLLKEFLKLLPSVCLEVVEPDELCDKLQNENAHHAVITSGAPIIVHGVIDFPTRLDESRWSRHVRLQLRGLLRKYAMQMSETTALTSNVFRDHFWANFNDTENIPVITLVRAPINNHHRVELVIYRTLIGCIAKMPLMPTQFLFPPVGITCSQDEDASCPCKILKKNPHVVYSYENDTYLPNHCVIIFRCSGDMEKESLLHVKGSRVVWKETSVFGVTDLARINLNDKLDEYSKSIGTVKCLDFQYCTNCLKRLKGDDRFRKIAIMGKLYNEDDRACTAWGCDENKELFLVRSELK